MSETVAIIPARGGSKRIARKNLLTVAGIPLVGHSIRHALGARSVRRVFVTTEDPETAEVARRYGAEVIERPIELAGDHATSESALLHALDECERRLSSSVDLVVFLQCTSPVRRPDDIDRAVEALQLGKADSLLSVSRNAGFIWEQKDGQLRSLSYDYRRRQRGQDLPSQFRENGSIYVFKPWVLREHNNRLGGRMTLYEMEYWSSFEIDTKEDAELCDWILLRRAVEEESDWPPSIDLIVFDFDGVMTDNSVDVFEDGRESVVCSRADGLGIERLHAAGVRMLVLSTERNPVVTARCSKLQLPCQQDVGDKATFLAAYLEDNGLSSDRVLYVGNDVNDLDCLRSVGMPVVVADAHRDVLQAARLQLSHPGGRGAVRELADRVLRHLQIHGA